MVFGDYDEMRVKLVALWQAQGFIHVRSRAIAPNPIVAVQPFGTASFVNIVDPRDQ